MPPFEVLLPLGAIGLYLLDSALLMYSNELLFLRHRRQWDFAEGSQLILLGRRVYLPNPLTPNVPLFRIRWSEHDSRERREQPDEILRFAAVLRPVQYFVLGLLLLLLALPVELLWFGTGLALLALFAAFYMVVFASLGYIYVRRRELRVSGKAFLWLSFDSLACAPFAINLVRKLSMRRSLAGNPIGFAKQTFNTETFARLVRHLCSHVEGEQQREEKQTPRWYELDAFRRELVEMLQCQSSK